MRVGVAADHGGFALKVFRAGLVHDISRRIQVSKMTT